MPNIKEQVTELLDRAMKQPGVAEVMRVYESQRTAIDAHERAEQVVAPRWVVSSSTSSSKQAR